MIDNTSTSGTARDYLNWLIREFKNLSYEEKTAIKQRLTDRANKEWDAIPLERQEQLTADLVALRALKSSRAQAAKGK